MKMPPNILAKLDQRRSDSAVVSHYCTHLSPCTPQFETSLYPGTFLASMAYNDAGSLCLEDSFAKLIHSSASARLVPGW